MGAARHPLRSHVMALFRRGEIVSVHEAVLICGASRQAIGRWIKADRIDVDACRLMQVARLRTRAQRQIDGLPDKKPSKAQIRRELDEAVRRFNAANRSRAWN